MESLHTAGRIILGAVSALFFFLGARFALRSLRSVLLVRKISAPLTILLVYFAFLIFDLFYDLPISPQVLLFLETFFLFLGIYLAIVLVETILVDYLFRVQKRTPPPDLLRDIVRWALVVVVVFGLLKVVLRLDITPIFFTSAAVTLVVGLALRDLLSNLFSGITLNMEKPFRKGDWVMAGSQVGEVINTTWRATRIKTLDGDFVIIPNSAIAREEIINYHAPSRLHARHLRLGVSYDVPPNRVKDVVVEAALETDGVLKKHTPVVWLREFGDFSITYEVKFWIDDYRRYNEIEDEVQTRIWYAFRRNAIQIPFPIRNVYMRTISEEQEELEKQSRMVDRIGAMRPIEILEPLTDKELAMLASEVRSHCYGRGEVLVRQGESGDSFFIITSGEVDVTLKDEKDEEHLIARLSPGEVFGEGSLLTGERRSATVTAAEDTQVIVIDKRSFAQILTRKPAICERLSEVLRRRLGELAEKRAAYAETRGAKVEVESSSAILKKIREFFRL
jgi:small-conductance mechanosensitive channel/CRP-like cAMP-binding protein